MITRKRDLGMLFDEKALNKYFFCSNLFDFCKKLHSLILHAVIKSDLVVG